jgi:colanic acid biosynthesis glycosyl transferase WcaI
LAGCCGGSLVTQVTPSLERVEGRVAAERRIHVLVVTSAYAPERTGTAPLNTELCEYLASRGHQVSVLTGFPHYPEWKVPPAYRGKLWQQETRNGVTIFRSYAYIPSRRTTLRRILYDTSIGLTAALRGLPIGQVDLVLAVSPPLQAGLAGCFLASLKRVPMLLDLHDLVPDLAIAVGMLRNRWAVKLAQLLENYIYRRADGILVISEEFAANLAGKNVPRSKISFLPLWVDSQLISPQDRNGPFRKAHNIDEAQTVVLYTGNMGAKQNLENVLEAAARLKLHRDVSFLFVGDGSEKKRLQEYAQERALSNVRFLPLVPPEPKQLLPEMLAAADVLVLNQSAQVVDMVIPSKLFTYMAAGRPIVASVSHSSQAASCIRRAGSGIAVDAEDPAALAGAIWQLKEDRQLAESFGRRGRLFVEEHCARDRILGKYEDAFLAFTNNGFTHGMRQQVNTGRIGKGRDPD